MHKKAAKQYANYNGTYCTSHQEVNLICLTVDLQCKTYNKISIHEPLYSKYFHDKENLGSW